MRNPIILLGVTVLVSVGFFFIACGGMAKTDTSTHGNNIPVAMDAKKAFKVEFKSDPAIIQSGATVWMTFTVKNEKGDLVKDLQIVHEKPMHLLIVSKDLAEFAHIHPEIQADGTYKVEYVFPNGGEYKLYADITPKDSGQVVEQIDVKVAGTERAKVELVPDQKLEKTVDGLRVVMTPDSEIKAGKESTINFKVFDAASGNPATDLQNYLGALAHFVIISEDMKDFVHAHPMEKGETMRSMKMEGDKADHHKKGHHDHPATKGTDSKTSSSEVLAHTAFPREGLYKLWAQFQRGGRVIVVPFVVRVPEATQANAVKNESIPTDAIKITVSSKGYEPSSFNVKKDQLVKLAFNRLDVNNCGGEVVFPKLNIRKPLPVGETVIVEFTPSEAGDLAFSCGMGMLKGKVVVN